MLASGLGRLDQGPEVEFIAQRGVEEDRLCLLIKGLPLEQGPGLAGLPLAFDVR